MNQFSIHTNSKVVGSFLYMGDFSGFLQAYNYRDRICVYTLLFSNRGVNGDVVAVQQGGCGVRLE